MYACIAHIPAAVWTDQWIVYLFAGIAACFGSIGYAIFSFKHKTVPTTIWVQQMRVQAQGMIVGAIIMGVGMKMWQERNEKKLTQNNSSS